MDWLNQFKIIKEIAKEKLKARGENYSREKFERFLGVARGRVQAWDRGQRPNADDLATISRKLNLCPRWVLLGEGSPRKHTTLKGQQVGNLLRDLLENEFGSIEIAADQCGLPIEELLQCTGPAPAPSWHFLKELIHKTGINANYLVTEQEPLYWKNHPLDRAALATGAINDWDLARMLGVLPEDVRDIRKNNREMPPLWSDILSSRYNISPDWLLKGTYPSHMKREEESTPQTKVGQELWEIEKTLRQLGASNEEIKSALVTHLANQKKEHQGEDAPHPQIHVHPHTDTKLAEDIGKTLQIMAQDGIPEEIQREHLILAMARRKPGERVSDMIRLYY